MCWKKRALHLCRRYLPNCRHILFSLSRTAVKLLYSLRIWPICTTVFMFNACKWRVLFMRSTGKKVLLLLLLLLYAVEEYIVPLPTYFFFVCVFGDRRVCVSVEFTPAEKFCVHIRSHCPIVLLPLLLLALLLYCAYSGPGNRHCRQYQTIGTDTENWKEKKRPPLLPNERLSFAHSTTIFFFVTKFLGSNFFLQVNCW